MFAYFLFYNYIKVPLHLHLIHSVSIEQAGRFNPMINKELPHSLSLFSVISKETVLGQRRGQAYAWNSEKTVLLWWL